MKLKCIVLLFFVCAAAGVNAQSTDVYMSDLLDRSDWFELEEAYPQKRVEMQSEMLKRLSEVMLYVHFNRPEAAVSSLDTLLAYHQHDLEAGTVYDLIALKSRLYAEQGLYQDASNNCAYFLNQLATFHISGDSFPVHSFIQRHYDEISYIPKPEVIRPGRDVEISFAFADIGRGEFMYIPVIIHGKEYRFLLDTGVDFTYLSGRMAKEMNIHISYESDEIKTISIGAGKIGAIDSMEIGDLKVKHALVMVGASDEEDEAFRVDAVLGLDFFRLVGETQLFPKERKVVFPICQTKRPKSGRNLMIDNSALYLKAYSGKERYIFQLNTGVFYSSLYVPYCAKHKEFIASKEYRLPKLPLKVGKKKFQLKHVPVSTEGVKALQPNEDGELGMDFIKPFKKVVINCDEMFLEVK